MSGLDSGNSKDYSKYDRMSTESLEELLRLDAELPDGEGPDIDEILYISEVIAKREKEHPTGRYPEIDIDAAWENFQTKYLPYMTDGRSLYDFDDEPGHAENTNSVSDISSLSGTKQISSRGKHHLRRVASLVAAIVVLLGLMTATAYAMGYNLWGVIAQWTKDTFTFVSASNIDDLEQSNVDSAINDGKYTDLQVALGDYGITEPLVPNWLPDGFSVEEVVIDTTSKQPDIAFCELCEFDDKSLIISVYVHHDPNYTTFVTWQKNESDVTIYEMENYSVYIMENEGQLNAVWTNGPYECGVSGDVTLDELYQIIKSI